MIDDIEFIPTFSHLTTPKQMVTPSLMLWKVLAGVQTFFIFLLLLILAVR